MGIAGPFGWLAVGARRRALFLLSALCLLLLAAFSLIDAPLRGEYSPGGMVSFELAGTLARAVQIMDSWGPQGGTLAALSLGLDFLFMPGYALAIGLACLLISAGVAGRIATVGILLAWGQMAAATFDALENLALIGLLLGSRHASLAPLAAGCAALKFTLVGLGLLYVLLGSARAAFSRVR